jgi:hypothetical protein
VLTLRDWEERLGRSSLGISRYHDGAHTNDDHTVSFSGFNAIDFNMISTIAHPNSNIPKEEK